MNRIEIFNAWRNRGLSTRAANVLTNARIESPRVLRRWSEIALLREPNCGKRTLLEILQIYRQNSHYIPGLQHRLEVRRAWQARQSPEERQAKREEARIGREAARAALATILAAPTPHLSETDEAAAMEAKARHAASMADLREKRPDLAARHESYILANGIFYEPKS